MAGILAQSGLCRRIVGRIDSGEEVCAALAAVCEANGVLAGEIRATGVLADLDLSELSAGGGVYRPVGRITGPLTLIQAYGNVSQLGDQTLVILRALGSWDDRGQHRVAGGHMLSATAVTVEFVIDAFDDLQIERALDPATGMPVYSSVTGAPAAAPAPSPAPSPETPAPAPAAPNPGSAPGPKPDDPPTAPIATRRPSGWDMVTAASEALDEEPEDEWVQGLDADMVRGDVLLHPRFGRCKILRIEDEERAILMDGDRKPRTVALGYMRVRRDEDSLDERVFEVKIGKG